MSEWNYKLERPFRWCWEEQQVRAAKSWLRVMPYLWKCPYPMPLLVVGGHRHRSLFPPTLGNQLTWKMIMETVCLSVSLNKFYAFVTFLWCKFVRKSLGFFFCLKSGNLAPYTEYRTTGRVYKFSHFLSNQPPRPHSKGVPSVSTVWKTIPPWHLCGHIARVSPVFPLREKLSHLETYASCSGCHHRCPVGFSTVKNALLCVHCWCAICLR